MILYSIFIAITFVLTTSLNLIFHTTSPLRLLLIILLSALVCFAIDAIVALIVHKYPSNKINPNKAPFIVFKFERKLYEFFGIRKWKDLVPETGQLCNFKKDKLYQPNDALYLQKFIIETCYAEFMHFLCIPLSFLTLFVTTGTLRWTVALPIAILNAFMQLLPAMIQRYLRPRLQKMLNRKLKILANSSKENESNSNVA